MWSIEVIRALNAPKNADKPEDATRAHKPEEVFTAEDKLYLKEIGISITVTH